MHSESAHRYEQVGLAGHVCLGIGCSISLLELTNRLYPPILHNQIMFLFDKAGVPLAFWTWAYTADDVYTRLASQSNAKLHVSEWNEGGCLVVMDFVAHASVLRDVIFYIRTVFGAGQRHIFVRRQGRRALARWRTVEASSYDSMVTRACAYRSPQSCFARSYQEWDTNPDKPRMTF